MDKNELFVSHLEEADVELSGERVVRVRALTRAELEKAAGNKNGREPRGIDVEMMMVVLGMVDPVIDINDAKLWVQKESGGEFHKVVLKISELSGMKDDEESEKETVNQLYADFRE